jgi:hypothetical protein
VSWTAPSGATSATTYAVERAPANSPTSLAVLPNASGLPATTLSFTDPTRTSAQSITGDPQIGTSYVYEVIATTGGTQVASSVSPATSPTGQGVGIIVVPSSSSGTPQTPFANSSSGVNYTYSGGTSATAAIKLQLTLDYTPVASDLRSITFNQNGGDQVYSLTGSQIPGVSASQQEVLTPAQIAAAVSVSGNTVTFDSSKLTGANALTMPIPNRIVGSLVTLNAYVDLSSGSVSTPAVAQITERETTDTDFEQDSTSRFSMLLQP